MSLIHHLRWCGVIVTMCTLTSGGNSEMQVWAGKLPRASSRHKHWPPDCSDLRAAQTTRHVAEQNLVWQADRNTETERCSHSLHRKPAEGWVHVRRQLKTSTSLWITQQISWLTHSVVGCLCRYLSASCASLLVVFQNVTTLYCGQCQRCQDVLLYSNDCVDL